MRADQIRETFRYHSPTKEAVQAHEEVRSIVTECAIRVARLLPKSRERSLFLTSLQRGQMMANAAIAIHGLPGEEDVQAHDAALDAFLNDDGRGHL